MEKLTIVRGQLAVDGAGLRVAAGGRDRFFSGRNWRHSTTMRLMPVPMSHHRSNRSTGRSTRSAVAPVAELGLLLEPKLCTRAVRPRTTFFALAQTNRGPATPVGRVHRMGSGLREVALQTVRGFSLAGPRLGVRPGIAGRSLVCLDEPVNCGTPRRAVITNPAQGAGPRTGTVFGPPPPEAEDWCPTATPVSSWWRRGSGASLDTTVDSSWPACLPVCSGHRPHPTLFRRLREPAGTQDRHHHQRAALRLARAWALNADKSAPGPAANVPVFELSSAPPLRQASWKINPGLVLYRSRRRDADDEVAGMTHITYAAPTRPGGSSSNCCGTHPAGPACRSVPSSVAGLHEWTLLTAVVLTIGLGRCSPR